MSTADPYLIAGGGHAARRAAETLRERDPAARIVMIGAEPELPYDRPVLSKEALVGGAAGARGGARGGRPARRREAGVHDGGGRRRSRRCRVA